MLAADTLLRAVQAIVPSVEGISIPDLGDSSTWVIHGLITKSEGLRALGVIRDQIAGSPSAASSGFWPAPPTALERDMALVKAKLGL